MSTTIAAPATGRRVELGRYRVEDQERIPVGRRIGGEVYVYDHPVGRAATTSSSAASARRPSWRFSSPTTAGGPSSSGPAR
ncbi:MAG TPA: hypothetical protein VHZ54_08855 [Solirubrobacterales bacterium]|nr:hypothetical protein [Solirubrobacterales bacterium]